MLEDFCQPLKLHFGFVTLKKIFTLQAKYYFHDFHLHTVVILRLLFVLVPKDMQIRFSVIRSVWLPVLHSNLSKKLTVLSRAFVTDLGCSSNSYSKIKCISSIFPSSKFLYYAYIPKFVLF